MVVVLALLGQAISEISTAAHVERAVLDVVRLTELTGPFPIEKLSGRVDVFQVVAAQ
jgi:hypothetical protein